MSASTTAECCLGGAIHARRRRWFSTPTAGIRFVQGRLRTWHLGQHEDRHADDRLGKGRLYNCRFLRMCSPLPRRSGCLHASLRLGGGEHRLLRARTADSRHGQLVAGAIGIMTSKLAALHAGFWLKDGTTARHQSEVAKALDDACAAFPSRSIRFSLFTVRHQFIANMKAVLQDDAVVSALIGRLIVKTERVHYTKVRAAWSAEDISEVPSPLVRDVGRFRRLLAMYQEALTIREAKSERRRIDEDVGKR
jgi:hypothetical protein